MKSHSTFWLGERNFNRLNRASDMSAVELVSYKRSIGRFVKILTKKNIPVTFRVQGDSYTDGKHVVISSNINQSNFDSIVGLALHEGSHIVLTDFEVLTDFRNKVGEVLKDRFNLYGTDLSDEISNIETNRQIFQSLLNYVEDRRIDYYVYTNSPGYKPYYEAMYDRFFKDRIIDKALRTNEYTDVTVQSYMFRIINFVNENTRFDALPDLEEIYNLIFDNISSMETTQDAIEVTYKIYKIIQKNVEQADNQQQSDEGQSSESGEGSEGSNSSSGESSDEDGQSSSMDGMGDDMDDSGGSNGSSDDEDDDSDSDEESGSGSGSNENEDEDEDEDSDSNGGSDEDSDSDEDEEREELTDRQKKLLPKKFKKQQDFLEGEGTQKATTTKEMRDMVESLSKMDIQQESVTYEDSWNGERNVDVVVVRGLNEKSFEVFDFMRYNRNYPDSQMEEAVNSGFRLGKRLGKKLQIRNRERTTTYNRQKKGKLDKRRIHALGTDEYNVFNQYRTEKHQDAFLHLSIDGSGSMSGQKFRNSIKSAVAMAQMAEMTNIDIEISIRYTERFNDGGNQPVLWVVYDSRKDKIRTIKKYFRYLTTSGTTPEGLCFDAIMDQLPVGSDSLKTYFINYSDGMPYFSGYGGEPARKHTRKQVTSMKKLGYTVLSFFISSSGDGDRADFEQMYGKSASFIDPTELNSLVRTLQKMFMKK